MAERRPMDRQPGWPQVVVVAIAVVAVVIGAAVVTGLLPTPIQRVVYDTPLAIIVLIIGTGWWLWRVSRRGPVGPEP